MMLRCSGWKMVLFAVGAAVLGSGPAACADTSPASALASLPDTIATGELYILGNRIELPYVFEVVRDSLYVNRILVYPYRDFMEIPADSVVHLDMRAQRLGLAMADSGRTDMEITAAMAAMYRSRPDLFSEVVVTGVGELVRTYVSTGWAVPVLCWSPRSRLPPRTLASRTASDLAYIKYWLERGSTIFVVEERVRAFATNQEGGYPEWVLMQLESPGQLRRLGERGDGSAQQPHGGHR